MPERTPGQREALARLMRKWILTMTHQAGSGHPTSALSAVELMNVLMFDGVFHFSPDAPQQVNNDRLIFSKGHASPLFYALWAAADQLPAEKLESYRQFNSVLEGHPTFRFPYTEAATGSLGQGLSIGAGMALNAKKFDQVDARVFVLLGDSEMAEGSVWEAMELSAHYELGNLIGILDVNRFGQRGETMHGHDLDAYRRRVEAFGWHAIMVTDGHDYQEIENAFAQVGRPGSQPIMIIAKTIKGKGVSFLADAPDWHGKALDDDQLKRALSELGSVDDSVRGTIAAPPSPPKRQQTQPKKPSSPNYKLGDKVATRDGYGKAITRLASAYHELISLDGEVCNSTRAKFFRDEYPERFLEMFIAEQNMVGMALGLALRGKIPFVSTFSAFLSRAADQIRMSPHSDANVKFVGSHAGVSIGQDGPSQMGLEDIALFRTLPDSVVLYPSDALSAERLVEALVEHHGIGYLRTTRAKTPIIYEASDKFSIGGSTTLRSSSEDQVTIVGAGITLHEALKAYEILQDDSIAVRVIDLYSIKPLDEHTLRRAADETDNLIVVEDHYQAGGIGETVTAALHDTTAHVTSLCVRKRPRSGSPDELLKDHGIDSTSIVQAARNMLRAKAST